VTALLLLPCFWSNEQVTEKVTANQVTDAQTTPMVTQATENHFTQGTTKATHQVTQLPVVTDYVDIGQVLITDKSAVEI
jgi:hypothetical protein